MLTDMPFSLKTEVKPRFLLFRHPELYDLVNYFLRS